MPGAAEAFVFVQRLRMVWTRALLDSIQKQEASASHFASVQGRLLEVS